MSFNLVVGDTVPAMDIDVGKDTSTAGSVQLRWVKPDGSEFLSNLTVVDAAEGTYLMEWAAGDTDLIGPYFGDVVITTGSDIETYPADGSKIIWWVNPRAYDLF